jgi:hypothetical protein
VTVNFGQTIDHVKVFTPSLNSDAFGTTATSTISPNNNRTSWKGIAAVPTPTSTATNISSITVSVGRSPVILNLLSTTTTPPPPPESAHGDYITGTTGQLVNAAGNIYTLTTTGGPGCKVKVDGVIDAPTNNVDWLEYATHTVVHQATNSGVATWWGQTVPGTWTQLPSDPLVTTVTTTSTATASATATATATDTAFTTATVTNTSTATVTTPAGTRTICLQPMSVLMVTPNTPPAEVTSVTFTGTATFS